MINNKLNVFFSLFKYFGLKLRYGSRVKIKKRFKGVGANICLTSKRGRIQINSHFKAMRNSTIHSDGGLIEIGENVFINSNSMIVSRERIKIGNNVSIGPNVCIYDHNHADERVKTKGEIIIGDKTWIGANSVILKGVCVGENVIIGAGSIVTESVPDNSVLIQKRVTDIKYK